VVVGAGVVGLAIARALARRGLQVMILEKERAIGTGTSARSSEVIHAGLYYEPGSLKAKLCVDGRRLLYDYCAERGIAHRRCGKLVVATDASEKTYLGELHGRAEANGVEHVTPIGAAEARAVEPALRVESALLSRSSGIVDSHALMLAYLADAEAAGATLALRTPVTEASVSGRVIHLTTGAAEPAEIETKLLVNAAGLDAWDLSRRLSGLDPVTIPPRHLAKGSYFTLSGVRAPFSHLIYPVPEPGGLGIHLTLDLAGQARFGPDVEWVDCADYALDALRGERFYAAIRRYWPNLPDGALVPAYCGIRPKVVGADGKPGDFVIQGPPETGVAGYIALYGIESPGLTSSLAIGAHVATIVSEI
jgi:L-2-hydroxyglutarate oxidase LhgO